MSGPTDIPGDQLRTIVERIERIDEEIKELNEGKREIFAEAKSNGFDVKVLREVIRIRKKDKQERDEQETLLELYMQAIETAKPAAKGAKAAAQVPQRRPTETSAPFSKSAYEEEIALLGRHLLPVALRNRQIEHARGVEPEDVALGALVEERQVEYLRGHVEIPVRPIRRV